MEQVWIWQKFRFPVSVWYNLVEWDWINQKDPLFKISITRESMLCYNCRKELGGGCSPLIVVEYQLQRERFYPNVRDRLGNGCPCNSCTDTFRAWGLISLERRVPPQSYPDKSWLLGQVSCVPRFNSPHFRNNMETHLNKLPISSTWFLSQIELQLKWKHRCTSTYSLLRNVQQWRVSETKCRESMRK